MQVHVGEYGVHWNFFFTLAAVSILTSMINIPPKYSGILGLLILVGILLFAYFFICQNLETMFPLFLLSFLFGFHFSGYQVCLMNGLNVYLLSNERGTDIISQNKEGIFSIFGEGCSDYCDIFYKLYCRVFPLFVLLGCLLIYWDGISSLCTSALSKKLTYGNLSCATATLGLYPSGCNQKVVCKYLGEE